MSIFISYSHKDQDYVNKLVEAIKKQELTWWVDNKIDYGDQWTREIEENLKKCQVFLLVMSPSSKESDWVKRELTFAQQLKKPIFPLLLDGEIWFQVIDIQIIDVKGGKLPPDIFFNKVRSKLNIQTAQSTAATPIPTPEDLRKAKDANFLQLVSLGVATCKKCGSKKLTDDDGNLICAYNQKDCPFLL
jgi:hypothetical protein